MPVDKAGRATQDCGMVALANVPAGTKPRRRGITLSETLVTAAALAVVLAALGLGTEGIRNDLKRQQAVA
ncbi:MAG TPA: hypothetical protein PLQ89_21060, partial [Phycisphaerae bacterium]|nr:hypothetical protein [Phycisphaerae bacterium]